MKTQGNPTEFFSLPKASYDSNSYKTTDLTVRRIKLKANLKAWTNHEQGSQAVASLQAAPPVSNGVYNFPGLKQINLPFWFCQAIAKPMEQGAYEHKDHLTQPNSLEPKQPNWLESRI